MCESFWIAKTVSIVQLPFSLSNDPETIFASFNWLFWRWSQLFVECSILMLIFSSVFSAYFQSSLLFSVQCSVLFQFSVQCFFSSVFSAFSVQCSVLFQFSVQCFFQFSVFFECLEKCLWASFMSVLLCHMLNDSIHDRELFDYFWKWQLVQPVKRLQMHLLLWIAMLLAHQLLS
jgi:hypothetical protein